MEGHVLGGFRLLEVGSAAARSWAQQHPSS